MFTHRKEVDSYIKACENLISAATMPGNAKLTVDECAVVKYYAGELSKITETETDANVQSNIQTVLWPLDTVAATR
ncbi:MAG: hypothetical protein HXY51_17685 [Nitrospirae bacterium]|nr:hypothetical protein [Nitrospirota bacterium]